MGDINKYYQTQSQNLSHQTSTMGAYNEHTRISGTSYYEAQQKMEIN